MEKIFFSKLTSSISILGLHKNPLLKKQVRSILSSFYTAWALKSTCACCISFVDPFRMKRISQQYRGKNKFSDVLTFRTSDLQKENLINAENELLGDTFICLPIIKRFCMKRRTSFTGRLNKLLAHSFCHMLGYDHSTQHEFIEMNRVEKLLLSSLSLR